MYSVYAIRSLVTGRSYIRQTKDFERRLGEPNAGGVRSTRKGRPWTLCAWEGFTTRSEAMYVEWRIKRSKGLRQKWLAVNKSEPLSPVIGG
jgi:predicted GIY-YIG superfamily endonuclease